METTPQPIFLLADSQLLFWSDDGELFLDQARQLIESEHPTAAYVGASNGDQPEFYQLFQGAMEGIGISDCRMIPSAPTAEDLEFFDAADLILLAGGDVERGWKIFEKNGLNEKVSERYYAGAVLIGVSAGAVQLGLHGLREDAGGELELFETFKLIPLVIDVHQEPEWTRLGKAMPLASDYVQGLGIPSGAGALVHPDMTIQPIRRPLVELAARGDEVRQNLILPPRDDEQQESAEDEPATLGDVSTDVPTGTSEANPQG